MPKHTLSNAADAAEIIGRLRKVTPQTERRWGTLTPDEMFCHLADSFRCGLGDMATKPFDTAFTRTVVKFVALRTPMRWPKGLPTAREFDPRKGGTKPAEFTRDRDALEVVMARFIDQAGTLRGIHPIFGRLTGGEWLRWGYLHMDHHLRQFGV